MKRDPGNPLSRLPLLVIAAIVTLLAACGGSTGVATPAPTIEAAAPTPTVAPTPAPVAAPRAPASAPATPTAVPTAVPRQPAPTAAPALPATSTAASAPAPAAVSTPVSAQLASTATPALPATAVAGSPPASSDSPADSDLIEQGKLIFDKTAGGQGCAYCHGMDGKGVGESGQSSSDIRGASRAMIRTAIADTSDMSEIKLNSEQLMAVVEYLQLLARQE